MNITNNSLIRGAAEDTLRHISETLAALKVRIQDDSEGDKANFAISGDLCSQVEIIKQAVDYETERCFTEVLPVNQLIRSHTTDTLCAVKETLTAIEAYFDYALGSDLLGSRGKTISSGLGHILSAVIEAVEHEINKTCNRR